MNPKDSCVFYRNWVEAAQTIKNEALRCRFYEAIVQYALDGMKTDVPPELEIALAFIYSLIDKDRAKYERICEKRREAGRKGGAPAGNQNASKDKQNQANQANACKNKQNEQNNPDNGNENENDNENDSQKPKGFMSLISPLTPQGAKGGAGASSFEDFFNRVKSIQIPKRVQDENYTAQYVWRMAEGNPGYGLAVNKAVATAGTQEEFVQMMQAINSRFKASSDFMAVKLALALTRCNPQQQAAAIAEAKRAAGEADLWKTLLTKVEYILNGNKVSSLAGFFKSRQK